MITLNSPRAVCAMIPPEFGERRRWMIGRAERRGGDLAPGGGVQTSHHRAAPRKAADMRLAYAGFRDARALTSALNALFDYGWVRDDVSVISRIGAAPHPSRRMASDGEAFDIIRSMTDSSLDARDRWRASSSRVSRALVELRAAPHGRRDGFLHAILPSRSVPEFDALLASGGWLLFAEAATPEAERKASMVLLAHADSNVHIADFVSPRETRRP